MKKYGKGIFAVLGVFLMLTFTLPSVMKNFQDPGTTEVGRLNGKKVTYAEISQANHEVALLSEFGLLPQLFAVTRDAGDVERGTRWFLLLREAAQNGIVASDSEVRNAVLSQQIPEALLQSRLTDAGLSQQDLRVCVAHAVMVEKNAILAASGAQVPLPEVEFLANEELSTVRLQYATIDGTSGWEKKPEPTAEQITKQFNLYKDVLPTLPTSDTMPAAIDGHTYPFGYKYADRVKVEFLKFDRTSLGVKFQPTRDDFQEAYRYYTGHLADFKKDSATSVTVGGQQKSFDEVKDQLVKDQVNDRVSKFLKRVTDRVLETVKVPWNSAKPDDGGYREALPVEKWADYQGMAKELKDSKEFDGYAPEYVRLGNWQDAQALAADEGIGAAYYETPNGRYPFAQVATHVKELPPPTSPATPKDDFPRLFQQVGTEGPLLQDGAGNFYIFRVTAAEPSHSPATADEVKAQVVEDLKKLAAYQDAQAAGSALAAQAATGDLSALAKQKGYPTRTVPEITHVGDDFPDVRRIYGLVNAAFDLARAGASTQPAGTQSAATQSASKKATSVNVDAFLSVYPVALDASNPATPEAFAANRVKYAQAAQQQYVRVIVLSWVRLEAVAKRLNYVPKTAFSSSKEQA